MSQKTVHAWSNRFQLRGSNGFGVVMLLGLLSALFFVPYIVRFESRDDPDRTIAGDLPGSSVFETLEYRMYDSYFPDSRIDESDKNDYGVPELRSRVAIVAIDQNSLNVVGQWPWPRKMHANLIRRLHKAGARVIALDIDFAGHQNPGADGKLSPDDEALIRAVEEAKSVVLPSGLEVKRGVAGAGQNDRTRNITYLFAPPFSEDDKGNSGLDEATPDLALSYMPFDSDGGLRRYPLVAHITGSDVGSFAALTTAVYQKMSMGDEKSAYETALRRLRWPSLSKGDYDVPTNLTTYSDPQSPKFQHFLLKYRARGSFATFSYSAVLTDYDDARMKRLFKDKIVFVGATAVILKDLFPTPDGQQISGVEIHAGVTCQLLEGSFIEPPSIRNTLINLFGLSLVSVLWPQLVRPRISRLSRRAQERWKLRKHFIKSRLKIQDILWFFLTTAMAVLPAIGFWILCQLSFNQMHIWTVATYPLLSSVLSASLAMIYLFTLETAERRKVMRQVGLYFDPDIMETILAYPEEDYPRPRRTTATVMFTDLQGFTSYSENHSAEEVVGALNAYMTRLHPIIKKHFGSVDKYIGDAIMSYFGVPVPRDDHATWALRCAVEIQEESCLFREETGIPFYTRVGIHTGELIAGSIGSQSEGASLINYTVIGDTVNVASRLEGKNKEFGSWILCSKATIDAAPGVANIEPVRDTIRGKSQEVEMFIVRGLAGEESGDERWSAPMNL